MNDEQLSRRIELFPEFVRGIPAAIEDLAMLAGIPNPARAVEEPEAALSVFNQVLDGPTFTAARQGDPVWLHARLLAYVGQLLQQRHGGIWFVHDDEPGSAHHGRYVVGYFERPAGFEAGWIDPSAVVDRVLRHECDLMTAVAAAEAEVAAPQ